MKRYANLPGIIHIDAIEQTDQGEREMMRPRPSEPTINSETY